MRHFSFPILCGVTAIASAFLAFTAAPVQAASLITATIGAPTSTSHVGYFVLDFGDTNANPESYAFAWNYEGAKTGSDFLLALQSSLAGPGGFQQTGAANNFITLLGYAGRTKFNDFGGNNSGDPNGYWNGWLGFDGQNWTNSQFGAADVTLSDTPVYTINPFSGTSELSGASWHGWRWVSDYSPDSPMPRVPTAASTAAPEPGSLTLLAVGGLSAAGIILRRRRRAERN